MAIERFVKHLPDYHSNESKEKCVIEVMLCNYLIAGHAKL